MISFIIPARNAGETIEKAIESINIPAEECEIVVVINGTDDETETIIERLKEKHSNLQMLYSEKGVSNARNTGLKAATGKWVFFLDADDEWVGDYKRLKEILISSEDIDLIFFDYYKNTRLVISDYKEIDDSDSTEDPISVLKWAFEKPTLRMTVWAKAYNTDFLRKKKIRFNNSLWMAEDSEFLTRCLTECSKVKFCALPAYRYYTHYISSTREKDIVRVDGYLDAIHAVEEMIRYTGDDVKEAFTFYVTAELNLIAVHDIFNCELHQRGSERRKHIKKVLDDNIISREVSKLTIKNIFKELTVIPSWCFKHRMYSVGGALCFLRSVYNKRSYMRKAGEIKQRE